MSRKWKCTFDVHPQTEIIEAETEEECDEKAQKYVGFRRAYFGYLDREEVKADE